MKKLIKGKVGTVLILIVTLILAGVAIFTAVRLYQLGNQSVAPNAPSSNPKAAENTTSSSCSLTFTITPQTPGLNCTGKLAYVDDSRNTRGAYHLDPGNNITPGSNVAPGQTIVYDVGYKNTGTATTNSALITDVLPVNVNFVDADNGCTYVSSTRTVTCNLGNVVAGGASQKAIRASILASAPDGSFTNNAVISGTGVKNSECQIALNVQTSTGSPTATPTGTPTATPTVTPTATPGPTGTPNSCGGTCGSNYNCNGGLFCYNGYCRNPSCQDQTDCNCPPNGTPNYCGGTCGSNYNCQGGFYCYQGFCRNPSCPSQTNCTCTGTTVSTTTPIATRTTKPTAPPTLPNSGTDWPTIVGAGVGIFVVIGSLLLAL
ncbi:MAG TPA: hypothetical protein VMR19_00220 [Candidatus Saccharimonadales bacterium]|jgi:uncharacterized repeat protein (TIGR01451 family)|nr:hypothetical protein [Candidatus Saccharimonadales bacterium]